VKGDRLSIFTSHPRGERASQGHARHCSGSANMAYVIVREKRGPMGVWCGVLLCRHRYQDGVEEDGAVGGERVEGM